MRNLINPKEIPKNVANLITSPITEMVCAFIIDISRNSILGFLSPFSGNNLSYLFLVSIFIILPWIMLGHGAIRYTHNKDKEFIDLSNNNLSNPQMPKRNLNLLSLLLATYIITKLFTL